MTPEQTTELEKRIEVLEKKVNQLKVILIDHCQGLINTQEALEKRLFGYEDK